MLALTFSSLKKKRLFIIWTFQPNKQGMYWPFCILQPLFDALSSVAWAEVDTGGGDCGEGASSPLSPDVPGLRLPAEGDLGDAPVLPLQRPPHRLPPWDLNDLDIVTGAPEIQFLGYWVDKKNQKQFLFSALILNLIQIAKIHGRESKGSMQKLSICNHPECEINCWNWLPHSNPMVTPDSPPHWSVICHFNVTIKTSTAQNHSKCMTLSRYPTSTRAWGDSNSAWTGRHHWEMLPLRQPHRNWDLGNDEHVTVSERQAQIQITQTNNTLLVSEYGEYY